MKTKLLILVASLGILGGCSSYDYSGCCPTYTPSCNTCNPCSPCGY